MAGIRRNPSPGVDRPRIPRSNVTSALSVAPMAEYIQVCRTAFNAWLTELSLAIAATASGRLDGSRAKAAIGPITAMAAGTAPNSRAIPPRSP